MWPIKKLVKYILLKYEQRSIYVKIIANKYQEKLYILLLHTNLIRNYSIVRYFITTEFKSRKGQVKTFRGLLKVWSVKARVELWFLGHVHKYQSNWHSTSQEMITRVFCVSVRTHRERRDAFVSEASYRQDDNDTWRALQELTTRQIVASVSCEVTALRRRLLSTTLYHTPPLVSLTRSLSRNTYVGVLTTFYS